jgi:hypothetical protein
VEIAENRADDCLGSLAVAVIAPTAVFILIAPWIFQIGGRWAPSTQWDGFGLLRDSAGVPYGLCFRLLPSVNYDFRNGALGDCCQL